MAPAWEYARLVLGAGGGLYFSHADDGAFGRIVSNVDLDFDLTASNDQELRFEEASMPESARLSSLWAALGDDGWELVTSASSAASAVFVFKRERVIDESVKFDRREVSEDEEVALLLAFYDAFNQRDLETALALLHPEVEWPNLPEGGLTYGRDDVRAYWQRQLQSTDPHVEPTGFMRESDQLIASVHETVRDIGGEVIRSADLLHVYSFVDNLIAAMIVVSLDESEPY